MIKLISCLFFIFSLIAHAHDQGPGLSSGSQLESQDISGGVILRCSDGTETRTAFFNCRDNILKPYERDYFIHPDTIDADTVQLRAIQENGKVRTKSEDYNSRAGRSKHFNLWIRTLFQRPLLAQGLNRIDFEMTKNGVIQEMGSFDVFVQKNPQTAQCRRGYYYSNNMLDCRSGGFICQRYFRDLNYCQ